MCPGRITVKAAVKRMVGGGTTDYALPELPTSEPAKHSLRWKVTSAVTSRGTGGVDAISIDEADQVLAPGSTAADGRSPRLFVEGLPQQHSVLVGSGTWGSFLNSDDAPIPLDPADEEDDRA